MTDLDRAVLDFEGQWWSKRGTKEQAIRDQFGVSLVRHIQRFNRLLDDPAAMVYAPMTVRRLRRRRNERRSA